MQLTVETAGLEDRFHVRVIRIDVDLEFALEGFNWSLAVITKEGTYSNEGAITPRSIGWRATRAHTVATVGDSDLPPGFHDFRQCLDNKVGRFVVLGGEMRCDLAPQLIIRPKVPFAWVSEDRHVI